jgi:hypothetical protein
MRTIQISTDTFAAIWKAQRQGELSEDSILRRILGVESVPSAKPVERHAVVVPVGFRDPRYGVDLPPNFEIFRNYLGTDYRAQAIQGAWYLGQTGKAYATLNELSGGIGITHENAWTNWFFRDEKGRRKPLSVLRDPSKIVKRNKSVISHTTDKSAEELGL